MNMKWYYWTNQHQAHMIVGYKRQGGHLGGPHECEVAECDYSGAHAHHDDYLKPLDVRWLCPHHHALWHQANGPGANRGDLRIRIPFGGAEHRQEGA